MSGRLCRVGRWEKFSFEVFEALKDTKSLQPHLELVIMSEIKLPVSSIFYILVTLLFLMWSNPE